MFGFYFLKQEKVAITDYETAKQFADPERYARFFHQMLERGVYFAPSQFEAGFVSLAHHQPLIHETLKAIEETGL
jgi:glutamate-1-semialdehyde 2,1-aminomutase